MTIDDLREMIEGLDGDIEVRLAMQPRWPFEYSIDRAILKTEALESGDPDEDDESPDDDDEVLYLTEGSQLGYTTKNLWK